MRVFSILLAAAAALGLSACAKLTLAWADLKPSGPEAAPAVLGAFGEDGPVAGVKAWETRRAPLLRKAFETHVYGDYPDGYELNVLDRKLLDAAAFDGAGRLIEYRLQADVRFGGKTRTTREFIMDVVAPAGDMAAPMILMQTFCPRWDTIPHPAVDRPEDARSCNDGGFAAGLMTYVFGRYIATPPIETILARGYAVATIFPSEFAPDRRQEGLAELNRLAAGRAEGDARWGAIIAWAWGYSLMIDALAGDGELKPADYVAFGHSRYAKAALVAAAFDGRIGGVIAHQSGTGGASLNRAKKGESVRSATSTYPHWFTPAYADYAGREAATPVDQHQLLALIAPRPILLGNARRDVWSDPNGAFRAAMGADPVYALYGGEGLAQTRLDQWKPEADIAFWLRPGTHGVVKEDWPAFLEFLDAHFRGAATTSGKTAANR